MRTHEHGDDYMRETSSDGFIIMDIIIWRILTKQVYLWESHNYRGYLTCHQKFLFLLQKYQCNFLLQKCKLWEAKKASQKKLHQHIGFPALDLSYMSIESHLICYLSATKKETNINISVQKQIKLSFVSNIFLLTRLWASSNMSILFLKFRFRDFLYPRSMR